MGDNLGGVSASAASTFSGPEIRELLATAEGLPDGWCLAAEPPYGQLVLTPVKGYHFSLMAMVVANTGRHGPIRNGGSVLAVPA